jgi:hypothetical protein
MRTPTKKTRADHQSGVDPVVIPSELSEFLFLQDALRAFPTRLADLLKIARRGDHSSEYLDAVKRLGEKGTRSLRH